MDFNITPGARVIRTTDPSKLFTVTATKNGDAQLDTGEWVPAYALLRIVEELPKTAQAPAPEKQPGNALLHFPADHEGHAQCVLALHPGRIAYNGALGWLWYTGTHWKAAGADAEILKLINVVLKARQLAAVQADFGNEFIRKCSRDAGRAAGILKQLEALVYVNESEFDASPDLLNCANGTLDLRTGQLAPHKAADNFTYCLTVPYTTESTPEYEELKAIIDGFTPDAAYLQVALGYSLTGHTSAEVMFFIQGPARSGKGSFTEAVYTLLMKPLVTEEAFETFTRDRDGDSQNFDLAQLKPCRCVFASEGNRHSLLNDAVIKRLTGGNWITCAQKYHQPFSYRPQFKLWLSSNFPPNLDTDGDAAWGRVRLMYFPHSHLDDQDESIKHKLKTPAFQTALLTWAVDGALMWYTNGLPKKDSEEGKRILEQTRQERDAQDTVLQFCEERLEHTNNEYERLSSATIYQSYGVWCRENGVCPKYINSLTRGLKNKHFNFLHEAHFRGFTHVRFV
jgi:putative DNA primase/helicase